MNSDLELNYINITLGGDTNAFSNLIIKYQDFVFTLVFRMLKNKEDAEEVTQDVFIKAYKVLNTFRGESKFSTWLYTIAYRKALDKLKNNKSTIISQELDSINVNNFSSIKNALDILEDNERRQIIKNCINRLSSDISSIFTMYYFEELSIKEVSEITKLSNENVKIKLFRGRKILYSILQKQLFSETILCNE